MNVTGEMVEVGEGPVGSRGGTTASIPPPRDHCVMNLVYSSTREREREREREKCIKQNTADMKYMPQRRYIERTTASFQ